MKRILAVLLTVFVTTDVEAVARLDEPTFENNELFVWQKPSGLRFDDPLLEQNYLFIDESCVVPTVFRRTGDSVCEKYTSTYLSFKLIEQERLMELVPAVPNPGSMGLTPYAGADIIRSSSINLETDIFGPATGFRGNRFSDASGNRELGVNQANIVSLIENGARDHSLMPSESAVDADEESFSALNILLVWGLILSLVALLRSRVGKEKGVAKHFT